MFTYVKNEPFDLGGQPLDRMENNSRTVKGAKVIGQDKEALTLILEPAKYFSKGTGNTIRFNKYSIFLL